MCAKTMLNIITQVINPVFYNKLPLIEIKIGIDLGDSMIGATIGRIFRNMAVINTHPALQLEHTAINAARARFGLLPFVVAPRA